MNLNTAHPFKFITILALFIGLTGCAAMDGGTTSTGQSESATTAAKNEPYFPTNFSDFEVPGELEMIRKNTLFINTASFTGGIINFTGRVEVDSLTDFFINSMQKNGWHLTGEVRYENILLAFTKPNKNCLITIYDGEFGNKTKVYTYITEDVLGTK